MRKVDAIRDGGEASLPWLIMRSNMNTTNAGRPMPRNHPNKNPAPLLFGLGVNNIRITVMMGTGLMAMPTAKGSICKTTSRMGLQDRKH